MPLCGSSARSYSTCVHFTRTRNLLENPLESTRIQWLDYNLERLEYKSARDCPIGDSHAACRYLVGDVAWPAMRIRQCERSITIDFSPEPICRYQGDHNSQIVIHNSRTVWVPIRWRTSGLPLWTPTGIRSLHQCFSLSVCLFEFSLLGIFRWNLSLSFSLQIRSLLLLIPLGKINIRKR